MLDFVSITKLATAAKKQRKDISKKWKLVLTFYQTEKLVAGFEVGEGSCEVGGGG